MRPEQLLLVAVLASCWRGTPPTPSSEPPPADAAATWKRSDASSEVAEIRLRGTRATAFEEARRQMDALCGENRYVITEEREEVVGVVTSSSGVVHTQVYVVHYRCAP